MKKILITTFLALVIAISGISSASAQKDKTNINGQVVSSAEGTLIIQSNKGEIFTVIVPDGFDISTVQAGDSVLVKGRITQDGSIQADSIKLLGRGSQQVDDDDEGEEQEPEGFRENSAFCAEGKQDRPHPLAPKLAERFGVSEEWVMERYCDGYSIGAIMLAIKTSQITGVPADADELLSERAAGNGWGQIWKGLGLIGSEKNGHSPPGLLKKSVHARQNK
jgi:hypothetical protein